MKNNEQQNIEDQNNNQGNEKKEKNSNEKKRRSNDQWTCPICFDKLQSPVVTYCGHVFCYDCIDRWLQKSDKCPICTKHVDRNDLIVVPGHGETRNIGTQERREHSKWNINDNPTLSQKIIFIVLIIIFIILLLL